MKDNYQIFGDKLGIDSTYKMIKTQSQSKSYRLVTLMGESSSKKIVPFCLALILDETAKAYQNIFSFFKSVVGPLPKIIISDDAIVIRSALR